MEQQWRRRQQEQQQGLRQQQEQQTGNSGVAVLGLMQWDRAISKGVRQLLQQLSRVLCNGQSWLIYRYVCAILVGACIYMVYVLACTCVGVCVTFADQMMKHAQLARISATSGIVCQ